MLEELTKIRTGLLKAIYQEDMLYAKMMVNRLDTVIHKLKKSKGIWLTEEEVRVNKAIADRLNDLFLSKNQLPFGHKNNKMKKQ